MAGHFYPPPPTFIGGRQPYAPELWIPPSGPAPESPPVRSWAAFNAVLGTHLPQPYALPATRKIAALIPAAAIPDAPPARGYANFKLIADQWQQIELRRQARPFVASLPIISAPPPVNRSNLRIIDALWDYDPVTVIYVNAIASIAEAPPAPDNPPTRTRVNFDTIATQWCPPPRPLLARAKIAPLLPAQIIPDAPPVRSFARFNSILQQWVPPYIPLPKLRISQGITQAPPVLLGQIPNLSAQFDSGTHQFDLSEYFANADTYAISPAVETGWSLDANTGILTIDTDDEDTFGPYTVTATNGNGDTDSNTFTVRVSAWDQAGWIGGTAVSADGVMGTTFLDDSTPVPAGSFFLGGIAHDGTGRRYVAEWPASNEAYIIGGIAIREDGAMLIDPSGTIVTHLGGIGLTYRGEIVAAVATPDLVHNGIGLKSDGTLCVSETS